MRETQGALSHRDILRMPARTFFGYVSILAREQADAEALRSAKGNRAVAEDIQQNLEAWRSRQPPPG